MKLYFTQTVFVTLSFLSTTFPFITGFTHPITSSPSFTANTNTKTTLAGLSDIEVDEIFDRYDKDSNGSIDRTEFRAVADKMRSSSRRREIISVATATFGSLFVSQSSDIFQNFQKTFRQQYIETNAEFSQQLEFPTALLSSDVDRAIFGTLKQRGFTPANTLFGHSICSDEVNNRKEQLIPLMVNRWKEGFVLGGLAGIPFAGKSGFGAYLHHVPENGKLLVFFAPHVGIGPLGRIGALQRDGQVNISSACGAAVGAYKALQKKKVIPDDPVTVLDTLNKEDTDVDFDPQLLTILKLLGPRLQGIEESSDSIAFVTYQMYGIIRSLMYDIILKQTKDLFDNTNEIAIVGGIMINRRIGGDFFQPLSFESYSSPGGKDAPVKKVDLFQETFGKRPDLLPILGSEAALSRLFND